MEDRAGCAPGRLPAPSQEIWLWNTGQAVTPAPPAPPRPGDVIVERGRAVAPPASPGDGIVEHGANFRPGRLDSPGPRIVEHRSGCPPQQTVSSYRRWDCGTRGRLWLPARHAGLPRPREMEL